MRLLRNFTLHEQGERELAVAAASGLDLSADVEGVEIQPGDSFAFRASQLATLLRSAAAKGHAVLAGGHTGLWICAVLTVAATARHELPDIYVFQTRRLRDEDGRFLFEPDGLARLPVPPGLIC